MPCDGVLALAASPGDMPARTSDTPAGLTGLGIAGAPVVAPAWGDLPVLGLGSAWRSRAWLGLGLGLDLGLELELELKLESGLELGWGLILIQLRFHRRVLVWCLGPIEPRGAQGVPGIGEASAVDILSVSGDERGDFAGALDGLDILLVSGLEQMPPLDLKHRVAHLEAVAAGAALDPADPHLAEGGSWLGLDLNPEQPGLVPHDGHRPARRSASVSNRAQQQCTEVCMRTSMASASGGRPTRLSHGPPPPPGSS